MNDEQVIDVVFRVDTTKEFKGTVFALMPHDVCDFEGNVTSYQHVGQHSSADYTHCVAKSRKATPEEYSDLKKELEGLGYKLNVVQRRSEKKYLQSYRMLKYL